MICKVCNNIIKNKSKNFCSRKCYLSWKDSNFKPIWNKPMKNWLVLEFSHRVTTKEDKLFRSRYWWKVQCKNCKVIKIKNADFISRDTVCQNCKHRFKGESGIKSLFSTYKKYCAENRNIIFDIDLENFKIITSSPCHYCGRQPYKLTLNENEWGQYLYNGIDQKKPCGGYSLNNVVPCCEICNVAKSDRNYEEFIEYLDKLSSYRNQLKEKQ